MPHAEVIVEVTDHTGRRDAHIVYARQAATGNNPEFSNEMARRLLRIRLDAHLEPVRVKLVVASSSRGLPIFVS